MREKCIIYITSTNYKLVSAGTEKFVSDLIESFKNKTIHSIQIFPLVNINNKMQKNRLKITYFGVNCDGNFFGVYKTNNIISAIKYICHIHNFECNSIIINQVHNWKLKNLEMLFTYFNLPIYIVVHDYMMVCPYMMKSDGKGLICGLSIEQPNAKHCLGCKYENLGAINFLQINNLLKKIKPLIKRIIFPSVSAKKNWLNVFPYLSELSVIRPHLKYCVSFTNKSLQNKIKIGYLGYISEFKGYSEWIELLNQLDKNRFEFYYFGSSIEKAVNDGANGVLVDFNKADSPKMVDQLIKDNIDIAFLWSNCQETYSYTYYEAFEAGCWVITSARSGNIASQVKINNNGVVFDNLNDCILYLTELKGNINFIKISEVEVNKSLKEFLPLGYFNYKKDNIKAKRPSAFMSFLYKQLRRSNKSEN